MREGHPRDPQLDSWSPTAGQRWDGDLDTSGFTRVRHRNHWRIAGISAVAVAGLATAVVLATVLHAAGGAASTSTGTIAVPHADDTPDVVRSSVVDQLQRQFVTRLDQPIEWVQTTPDRLPNPMGIAAGTQVYAIQIRGSFVCRTCKGFVATPQTGTAIVMEFPVDPGNGISAFTLTDQPYDLRPAGEVHTFTIDYPSPGSS